MLKMVDGEIYIILYMREGYIVIIKSWDSTSWHSNTPSFKNISALWYNW